MSTIDANQPEAPAEAETSRAPKLGLVHGSAGLVFRLRAMADSDKYAIDDWSEGILREAADTIARAHMSCQTCERWESYDADRLGFCPIFQKRTASDHGAQCTAHSALPNDPAQQRPAQKSP